MSDDSTYDPLRLSYIIIAGIVIGLAIAVVQPHLNASSTPSPTRAPRSDTYDTQSGTQAQLVLAEIDGCSYVVAYRTHSPDSGVGVVHHAGCRNPAHAGTGFISGQPPL